MKIIKQLMLLGLLLVPAVLFANNDVPNEDNQAVLNQNADVDQPNLENGASDEWIAAGGWGRGWGWGGGWGGYGGYGGWGGGCCGSWLGGCGALYPYYNWYYPYIYSYPYYGGCGGFGYGGYGYGW